jgi:hypothetical protein
MFSSIPKKDVKLDVGFYIEKKILKRDFFMQFGWFDTLGRVKCLQVNFVNQL